MTGSQSGGTAVGSTSRGLHSTIAIPPIFSDCPSHASMTLRSTTYSSAAYLARGHCAITGFTVPVEKRRPAGRAVWFRRGGPADEAPRRSGARATRAARGHAYVSGGQGLWSTLDDYLALSRGCRGSGRR